MSRCSTQEGNNAFLVMQCKVVHIMWISAVQCTEV